MRVSSIIKLKNEFISDIDFFHYQEAYDNKNVIDKDLLMKLLEKYHDLYYTFLRMNLFLYRFKMTGLNDELKDFNHYKGKPYRIDDLSHIFGLYYHHYSMFVETFKLMISNNLIPKNEIKLLEKIINNPREEQIRPTFDFEVLDDLLDDINSNDFVVISSRPGMGKSTLGYNIVNKVSKRIDGNILYFNYETSKDLLKSKITSNNVEIVDGPTTTVEQIKSKCESTNHLSLVVIDYLQLIPSSCNDTSKNEIDYISRTLKTLTLELNVPIIVLSQLGRQVENRENKRPILRDLDIMGSLVQDSDKVIFLYRESYYNKDYKVNDLELIVAKNRGGYTDTIRMLFKDKGSPNE